MPANKLSPSLQAIEDFKKDLLKRQLDRLEPEQRKLFGLIFPGEKVPNNKLETAFGLIDRTLAKNEKKAQG